MLNQYTGRWSFSQNSIACTNIDTIREVITLRQRIRVTRQYQAATAAPCCMRRCRPPGGPCNDFPSLVSAAAAAAGRRRGRPTARGAPPGSFSRPPLPPPGRRDASAPAGRRTGRDRPAGSGHLLLPPCLRRAPPICRAAKAGRRRHLSGGPVPPIERRGNTPTVADGGPDKVTAKRCRYHYT